MTYEEYKLDVFNVHSYVHIFITEVLTAERLRQEWKQIRNEIAMESQRLVESEFERWNYYIFYQIEDKSAIDYDLIDTIERNTISSRKILVSKLDKGIDEIIKKYIKMDLEIDEY